jgi:hypothetical protein
MLKQRETRMSLFAVAYFAAFAAGVSFVFQQAVNSNLRLEIDSPWWAGFASYLGGTIVMLVMALALREPFPGVAVVARSQGMSWTGGLFGAIYIAISILLLPRLGGDRDRPDRCRADDRFAGLRSFRPVRLAGASHDCPANRRHVLLTAQPFQHDADLLFRRILSAGLAPNVLQYLFCRRFTRPGFLLHLRSLRLR